MTDLEREVAEAIALAQSEWRNGSDSDWTASLADAALNAVASHFDLCRQDWETLPCLTCGAGL